MEPFQTLFQISKLLLSEDDAKTPEILLHRVLEATGAERGFIVVREDNRFVEKFHVRFDRSELSGTERHFSKSIIRESLRTRAILHSNDIGEDTRFQNIASVQSLGKTSVLVAPLVHEDELYGAVYLERQEGMKVFRPEAMLFLREFTEVAGLFIKRAIEREEMRRRNRELTRDLFARHDFKGIVTRDPKMMELLQMVAQVADADTTILVRGESGTGKELIVRALHANSHRRDRPFVTIHCTALPATILESELFGHKKGAFTGAQQDRTGRIASADGGTVFLDEIAEIPPELQAKLLRFLQFGEIQRLGSDDVETLDVRILTATHRDLQKLVETGEFREDLYFRLNVVELKIPPLRERRSDLPVLLDHFTKKYWKRPGESPRWSQEARDRLWTYGYPGNVRELEHLVERGCLLARGSELGAGLLPPEVTSSPSEEAEPELGELTHDGLRQLRDRTQIEAECRFLAALLSRAEGNISQAARSSGISRPYLQRLVTKHRDFLEPYLATGSD